MGLKGNREKRWTSAATVGSPAWPSPLCCSSRAFAMLSSRLLLLCSHSLLCPLLFFSAVPVFSAALLFPFGVCSAFPSTPLLACRLLCFALVALRWCAVLAFVVGVLFSFVVLPWCAVLAFVVLRWCAVLAFVLPRRCAVFAFVVLSHRFTSTCSFKVYIAVSARPVLYLARKCFRVWVFHVPRSRHCSSSARGAPKLPNHLKAASINQHTQTNASFWGFISLLLLLQTQTGLRCPLA